MIRSTSKSGHTLLEVCSKNQWKLLFPQHNPRKSCYDNRVAGLIGHWRMDEQTGNEVADDSGHENHGSAGSAVSKQLYGWKTKGTLDEYRLYNKALDKFEVAAIYKNHLA